MLITHEGKIIRINVAGVRVSGRSTQGVKLMNLDSRGSPGCSGKTGRARRR